MRILPVIAVVAIILAGCDRGASADDPSGPYEPDPANFVWPPPVPEPADDRDAHCRAHADENACEADDQCRVHHRASQCTPDGMCTEDLRFHFCGARPVEPAY